ncbi:MAG: alkaline phosphatase family protein, partial [Leptospiraceae bacterium]|nr:alkaline phosphatase family protein [Leptospiraceae bacterium]
MKFLILFFLLSSIIFANSLKDKKQNANKKKLIILSIDGFPGYYFEKESKAYEKIPNLRKLAEKGSFSNNIRSVFPTLTYPAHTSMITGSDPAVHGIHYNSPNDPRGELKGDWYWFNDDIKVKTILDFANESN